METQRVWVVGAGTMGGGIAQACAQSGLRVGLFDTRPGAVEAALRAAAWSVEKLAARGRLRDDPDAVLARIEPADRLEAAADADVVVEAVVEDRAVKQEVFRRLDAACRPDALLASNTSSIPITELAAATARPERVVGLHFFNPVPLMPAVEVVRGVDTGDGAVDRAVAFVRRLGKEPIRVERDVAGFVINRINLPSSVEAMRLVEQGVTTVEDVDRGVKLALGRRMGIFETGDLVGLDVTHATLLSLYEETGDPRWFPPEILRRKVRAGHLGRKAGRGWYEYGDDGQRKGGT